MGWIDGLLTSLRTPRDPNGLPVVWSWQRGKLTTDPLEEGTYDPPEAVARIAAHGGLVFALPYLVVAGGLSLFETSEVRDTLSTFALLATLFIAPLMAAQLFAIARKARAQLGFLRAAGALTPRTRLDAVARAAELVTPRGAMVLASGAGFLVLSLRYQWADLGVMAVMALTAFYLVTALASLHGAFVLPRFSSNLLERGAVLHRRFEPSVVRAGEGARDLLDLRGVPVPPGTFLLLEGALPARLATHVRHAVPPKAREERLTLTREVKRSARGVFDVPPLRASFTDLLGLTRTTVASLTTARLSVLPAVRPCEVVSPPPSNTEEPDLLSRPHRFPTEELFRFREYVAGDDTRRIQWSMSMRSGRMIVKTPDSRETSAKRVVVALDTWVPEDWRDHTIVLDDALDSLVDAWLSLAQRLESQGERVSLLLVARGADGEFAPELLPASGNHARALDAGARAEWQPRIPIEQVLAYGVQQAGSEPGAGFDNAIVVTMRLATPRMPPIARETTWVYYDPDAALGPPPKSVWLTWLDHDDVGRSSTWREVMKRLLFLPYPVGGEENGLFARVRHLERRLEARTHRLALRARASWAAKQAMMGLLALPDAVYRLEVVEGQHRLVGLKGAARAQAPIDPHAAQRRVA